MSNYNGAKLSLASTEDGYAVFADELISAGSTIEHCVILPQEIANKAISHQLFDWGDNKALALGYGSHYRKSGRPNADAKQLTDKNLIQIYALRDIKAGEEITLQPKTTCYRGKIIIGDSKISGYGIISEQHFEVGELIEVCPTIELKNQDNFSDYLFGLENGNFCLPLGYGCLYNHSDDSNADYFSSEDESCFLFKAKKPINPGDEITINYGNEYWDGRSIGKKA